MNYILKTCEKILNLQRFPRNLKPLLLTFKTLNANNGCSSNRIIFVKRNDLPKALRVKVMLLKQSIGNA